MVSGCCGFLSACWPSRAANPASSAKAAAKAAGEAKPLLPKGQESPPATIIPTGTATPVTSTAAGYEEINTDKDFKESNKIIHDKSASDLLKRALKESNLEVQNVYSNMHFVILRVECTKDDPKSFRFICSPIVVNTDDGSRTVSSIQQAFKENEIKPIYSIP